MRKSFLCLLLVIMLCSILAGCKCEHEWEDSDCVTPKTCSLCDETKGRPLGHKWKSATCTSPETCSRCEKTRGTPIDHTWTMATCTEPKTCSSCGCTEGNPLGHKEGDWEVTKTDMVAATEEMKKFCITCDEQLDRKMRDMDCLHDTYRFRMTPCEFVERLDNQLDDISGCPLTARSGSTDGYFACGILTSTSSKAGAFLFVGDGDSVSESQKYAVCFDGALGTVHGDENLAYILFAIIETCDPSLSFTEAKNVAKKVLDYGSYTENGITYLVSASDGKYIVAFALED